MTSDDQRQFHRDEQASGRFLAAVGGVDEAELVHFRALVASEAYTIAALDLNHTFVSWSRGGETLFGYSAAQMVGSNLAVLLTEVDEPLAQLSRRTGLGQTVELDTRLRCADGTIIHAFVTAAPVKNPEGTVVGIAVIIRDISQAKEMERRLRETSQLEAMARAAAGVAHEINNVLAIVQAYAEFVGEGPLTAAQTSDLKLAQEAAHRGATLTSQLLALNKPREVRPVEADLNQLVAGMEDLLRRVCGAGIDVSTRLALSPLKVKSSPGQIDQILLNIVLNARDAMPGGGKLELLLHGAVVGPGHPALGRVLAGSYAKLTVRDNGIGMDETTLARAFEPFFTTKPAGRGAGIGLMVVKETLRELGGAVTVDSALDRGTTFTVYLPLQHAAPTTSPPPRSIAPAGDVGAILVVDSDAVLRVAIRRILKGAGHSVLEASGDDEADALLRAYPGPVAAVISNVGRPGHADSLKERWPELRRVYLSGQQPGLVKPDPGATLVAKPFAAGTLLSAVRDALSAPATIRQPEPSRRAVVLIVDDDDELSQSLARVLAEVDLEAHTSRSALHALQLLKKLQVDVLVTEQAMPGMEGTKLLELALSRYPATARILFTSQASPDLVVSAVNRGRVAKVLLKSMHPVAIRDEISAIAVETMRRRARSGP